MRQGELLPQTFASGIETRFDNLARTLPGAWMAVIKIRDNEPFEIAMKRFKKQCEKAGILSDLKRREYYDKPSVRKKKKAAAARKRALKKQRRMTR